MHLSVALPAVFLAVAFAVSACASHQEIALSTVPTTLPSPVVPLVDADCGAHPPVARPSAIMLACADGSLRLEDATWSSWDATAAAGTAVMHANTCLPDCVHGVFRDYPAAVRLSGTADRFDEVTLTYAGAGPDGRQAAAYPVQ